MPTHVILHDSETRLRTPGILAHRRRASSIKPEQLAIHVSVDPATPSLAQRVGPLADLPLLSTITLDHNCLVLKGETATLIARWAAAGISASVEPQETCE